MFKSFHKFGLAHCDFPTVLSNVALFLRTLSLNVDPRNKAKIPTFYTILDIAFAASYCYVYLVSMIWFVFVRCMETGEILSALIIFSLGTASQIGPWKIVLMFYNRTKITHVAGQCLESFSLVQPGSSFSINLMRSMRIVKKRAITFWSVVMGNGILYIAKPIILPGRHLMEDLFILLGLEPMFETPNYQIALILTAMGVCVAVYLPSNATAFQIIISGYIEAQMIAWSDELLHIWDEANINYSQYTTQNITSITEENLNEKNIILNKYVSQRLKEIIRAHGKNLSLLSELEEIFKGAIAIEFGLLMVSLIAELLAGLQNTYMEVPFALIQVGMDCFIGQKLIDSSKTFEKAVYHSKWEKFNKDNMKLTMVVLMTSQKTMTLSAGSFTKLNFVSLLAIFKMIYSAYTTLSATMK